MTKLAFYDLCFAGKASSQDDRRHYLRLLILLAALLLCLRHHALLRELHIASEGEEGRKKNGRKEENRITETPDFISC